MKASMLTKIFIIIQIIIEIIPIMIRHPRLAEGP